jgi:signal transduction histidine kinase
VAGGVNTVDEAMTEHAIPLPRASHRVTDVWLARAGLFVITAAVVVVGLQAHVDGGITSVNVIAFTLTMVWALVGVMGTRAGDRTAHIDTYYTLAGLDALLAAVALTAGRVAQSQALHPHGSARSVATMAALLVTAVSFHLLLSLPDGRLPGTARRAACGIGYAAAVAVGLVLVVRSEPLSLIGGGISWSMAAVCAAIPLRTRYDKTAGHDRERLQWFAIGGVIAASVALTAAVLHAMVAWPRPLGAVAAGGIVVVPVSLLLGDVKAISSHGGRILVRSFSVFGLVAMVSAIYLVVVLGLGHKPATSSERTILGLSMLATALAAAAFVPTRERLTASATRFVYGAREAPDEVVRSFGSRLTRAIPMDELLLQLAESLRKTMTLTSAEIYTGMGEVLERAVSVPDLGPASLVISQRERPVVTRAGISGNAWASVWLPDLVAGRETEQLRVAPISHAGELLGLVVVERPAGADSFAEDDDRVLTDLARQVGLAFHNSQLDTALQTTLDELRKQADALRESRARIVASGDAERRRVERNLHDGAQQHLVALAVNLRLAKDIIADDPSAGNELLDQLAVEVQETIQELRELAHGIYPPLLVDSGLLEALKAAANRNPLPVDIVADGIGRYSSETEAAVYFCCLEALQNAAKHAPDAEVEMRLWEESGGLLFSVSDNGPGYDAAKAQKGHGYVNMSDRLGAIGGTVRWESQPGHGSIVRGSVPLLESS